MAFTDLALFLIDLQAMLAIQVATCHEWTPWHADAHMLVGKSTTP